MKAAIIIADTYGEPFETIKRETKEDLVKGFAQIGVDVFYFIGEPKRNLHERIEKLSNRIRYSKTWPIQRFYDAVALFRNNVFVPEVKIDESQIFVKCPEGLRYLGVKDLAVMEHLYKLGYQIIYKTTLSSIFPKRNFEKWIQEINNDPYYGGTLISFGSIPFVSGANLMLNRTAIEILLKRKWKWNHGELDDVAIGKILNGKVKISPIKSRNISTIEQVGEIPLEELRNLRHIRCKSQEEPRNDLEIIRAVLREMSLQSGD